jgi:hypothetical protein
MERVPFDSNKQSPVRLVVHYFFFLFEKILVLCFESGMGIGLFNFPMFLISRY